MNEPAQRCCHTCGRYPYILFAVVLEGLRVWVCPRCYWTRANSQPVTAAVKMIA